MVDSRVKSRADELCVGRFKEWKLVFVGGVVVIGLHHALMKFVALAGGWIKIRHFVVIVFMVLMMNFIRRKFTIDQVMTFLKEI